MKKLKFLVLFLVVISASFIAVGFIVPTVSYETTVLVNKPVLHSFSVFNNPFNLKKWLPGFKSATVISGFPNQVGSVYEMVFEEEEGEEVIMMETMTGYEFKKLFAFDLSNDVLVNKVKITFEEIDGKTKITSTSRVTGKNMVVRSMFPFMKSKLQERDQEAYDNLKELIESSDYQNSLLMDLFLNRG